MKTQSLTLVILVLLVSSPFLPLYEAQLRRRQGAGLLTTLMLYGALQQQRNMALAAAAQAQAPIGLPQAPVPLPIPIGR